MDSCPKQEHEWIEINPKRAEGKSEWEIGLLDGNQQGEQSLK